MNFCLITFDGMIGALPRFSQVTGNRGFDSGEGALEMATTSKEGSRSAIYPILKQGGSDKI